VIVQQNTLILIHLITGKENAKAVMLLAKNVKDLLQLNVFNVSHYYTFSNLIHLVWYSALTATPTSQTTRHVNNVIHLAKLVKLTINPIIV
jgi:hypothetical protein